MLLRRTLFPIWLLFLVLPACGVKRPPSAPIRATPAPNLDCSIYDQECSVSDPQYDPDCDPAKPQRPAVCDLWNLKYARDRAAWRKEQERRKIAYRRLLETGKDPDKIREEDLAPPSPDPWQFSVTP